MLGDGEVCGWRLVEWLLGDEQCVDEGWWSELSVITNNVWMKADCVLQEVVLW